MTAIPESITVSDDEYAFPVSDLLTGRGAVFGKSGSGKSNTASVLAEELLECGLPIVIVDVEGEYWGLAERYDVRYAGTTPGADVTIATENVEELVSTVLEGNEPLVLDVSGVPDVEATDAFLSSYVSRLFERENRLRKPCLLFVEEIHEFLPQTGRRGAFADVLVTVAKRGRKRGLGLCGLSQRPAAVDKEFITQCDWIAWHRLTWENDTRVVEKILGSAAAEPVTELADGEALVMTDWDETLTRVQFQRKRTFDAGGTPDLSVFETTALDHSSSVDSDPPVASALESPSDERNAGLGGYEDAVDVGVSPASPSGEPTRRPPPPRTDEFDSLAEAALLTLYGGSYLREAFSTSLRRSQGGRTGSGRPRRVRASDVEARRSSASDVGVRAGVMLGLVLALLVISFLLLG